MVPVQLIGADVGDASRFPVGRIVDQDVDGSETLPGPSEQVRGRSGLTEIELGPRDFVGDQSELTQQRFGFIRLDTPSLLLVVLAEECNEQVRPGAPKLSSD